jgi:hypothetical protein
MRRYLTLGCSYRFGWTGQYEKKHRAMLRTTAKTYKVVEPGQENVENAEAEDKDGALAVAFFW